jgi:hypothetical protein
MHGNLEIRGTPRVVQLTFLLNADYSVKYIFIDQNSTQPPILVKTL